jgi:TolB-like protein/cytochrome c-type biogenesis protein CcmH/NrfG
VAWKLGVKSSKSTQVQASIAVLPLVDLSPDKNQDYFSDGLTEELMNGLAKIPGLRVAGRTSSFQFKGKTDDCRVIGEKLNVASLLEGSVRKQDNKARIAVQLIKAGDGFSLWSESFDRELTDILAVEEEISRAVAAALKITLLGGKATLSARSTNPEAYNACLKGRYFRVQPNKENLEKAVGYFEQAIKLAPDYASAWKGLGDCRMSQADLGYIPVQDGYRQARLAIERALAIDVDLGPAHAAMGSIKMVHDWDWTGADASYQRALRLEPGDVSAILAAGVLAKNLGRLDQAISMCRTANERDPLSPGGYQNTGTALYYAGRQEEAKAALSKALELAPEMVNTHGLLGRVYLAQSDPQSALSEARKEKHPAFRLHGQALAYHALGRNMESNVNLTKLITDYSVDAPYQIAEVYAFRGETDRAFAWLERAYSARDTGLSEMKGDPLLTNLVHDSRYSVFLKRMHLSQ